MIAVLRNDYNSVNLLIQAGALLNERDEYGRTALDLADQSASITIKDILRTAHANIHNQPCFSLICDEKSIE
jgi:ankyrin repeat protein